MTRYMLSISEFAKLKNITSETLRHYDRIGLLKPAYLTESGHRCYSIRQYEKLGTILELREIGMSLEEIKKYFECRNLQKSIQMLTKYQQKFEEKLEEQIQLNNELLQKLEYLKHLPKLPKMNTVFEKNCPKRYIVTFEKKAGDREEHAMEFINLEKHIHEKIPIIASDRVGVYADESLLLPSDKLIPAIPMIFVSAKKADEKYLQEVPEGKYVCMFYKNGILEKYDNSFEIVKKYIKEKGYRICGNILQIYKIDVTLTDDSEETVLEIQIPVQ